MPPSIEDLGKEGEHALNLWLRREGFSYLYIDQKVDYFAPLFRGNLKRPDFLVLLESIGLIAVDAKNYTSKNGTLTLKLEKEVRRVMTFERIFRLPVWYAYLGKENDKEVWFWISALKAIEVGKVLLNAATKEEFLSIPIRYFEKIEKNADMGKLYTHRLRSLGSIKRA